MEPIQELRAEHEGILTVLRIMERICEKVSSGKPVPAEHMEGIIEFLRVFADRCHHGKEEDVLFPALERAGIPREGGPIGVMLTEHGHGRGHISAMNSALEGMKAGDQGSAKAFVEAARQYIDLLTNHISKENNVLFPMAEKALPPQTLQAVYEEFERIEKERIGEGRHEAFHKMIEELAKIYL